MEFLYKYEGETRTSKQKVLLPQSSEDPLLSFAVFRHLWDFIRLSVVAWVLELNSSGHTQVIILVYRKILGYIKWPCVEINEENVTKKPSTWAADHPTEHSDPPSVCAASELPVEWPIILTRRPLAARLLSRTLSVGLVASPRAGPRVEHFGVGAGRVGQPQDTAR